jgi:hypothetical protein
VSLQGCGALERTTETTVIHTIMTLEHHVLVAARLSDADLLARLQDLAGRERLALVELLAHLAELAGRRSVYLAAGYGTLFAYCRGALRFSEDAAYNRVEAARACRRFPVILDLLADGSVTLTAVRMLGRHLTAENHAEVLAAARGRSKPEIEALVASLAPKPDLPPVIRRLPDPVSATPAPALPLPATSSAVPGLSVPARAPEALSARPGPRPVIRASAPARYHVQLTIGQQTHDRFRRLQSLLARECGGGDPVAVFDLACRVLEEKVLKEKRAAATKPRKRRRSGTAVVSREAGRAVPAAVSRQVWARDGERCAFVGAGGVRCQQTKYLELHHTIPWALCRRSSPEILSVRCRAHNQYEAQVDFGDRAIRAMRSKAGRSLSAGP